MSLTRYGTEIVELLTRAVGAVDAHGNLHAPKGLGKLSGRFVESGGTFDERVAAATQGRDVMRAPSVRQTDPSAFTPGTEGLPDRGQIGSTGVSSYQVLDALEDYQSDSFIRINEALREGKIDPAVRPIDAAMSISTLATDVVVYRGVRDSTKVFPGTTKGQDLTGVRWTDGAFVSASYGPMSTSRFTKADPSGFDEFGRVQTAPAPVQMRILAPAGTHALASHALDRSELLLDRGLTFRVVRDAGVDADGVRHLDVVVEVMSRLRGRPDASSTEA